MFVLASIRIALRALRVNKLRSALTMLGIVIGVGAVIAMVAIGSGASQRIQEQIASIGSNLLIVLPGSATSGGMRMGHGSTMTLTEDDARAIATEVPGVVTASGSMRGVAQIVFGNQNWSTAIQGTMPDYLEIRDWELDSGRFFTQEDADGATKVAVLGQTVKDNLFGDGDAIGQIIRIKKVPFTVIGVLTRKGQTTWGQDQDDTVIIPLSTAKKRVLGVSQANARFVGVIQIKAASPDLLPDVQQQATDLLRQRHRLQPYQDNDFDVRNLAEMFAVQAESSRDHDALAGGHRLGLPARRGHRDHEHHAGVGDGADPGDRPAHGGGGAQPRHPGPVPDRGGDPRPGRGASSGSCWASAGPLSSPSLANWSTLITPGLHRDGLRLVGVHRHLLRLFSRQESRLSGPHRGAALRVTRRPVVATGTFERPQDML